MNSKIIHAADLFCGAGGSSAGLVDACKDLGLRVTLTAINHWDVAIATHTANHPGATHHCASLETLNPRELFKEGGLDLMWASPECMHHSIARGGKPINDQSRSTAWHVIRWAEALRPSIIMVENVKEFLTWGPIGTNGRPLKSKKGQTFNAWKNCLESLGYRVDWRILCAADYGDPTTRRRLFVQAVRGNRPIRWPKPTHAAAGKEIDMFRKSKNWIPARDIIDWSIEGQSIFERKRPLSEKTMQRIWAGLEKFGLRPYIVPGYNEAPGQKPRTHDVEQPIPTVAASGHTHLAEPYLVRFKGQSKSESIDKPLSGLTTKEGHGLARPFLLKLRGKNIGTDIEAPVPTITAGGTHIGVADPYLIQVNRTNGDRVRSVEEPFPTVCGNRGEYALCEFLLLPHTGNGQAKPVSEPVSTVMPGSRSMRLIEPIIVKFYGNSNAASIDKPLDSQTTKQRFALVKPIITIEGEDYILDILFRMLQPKELAAAQGFKESYLFTGNKTEQVKQIGNAVPRGLAEALCRAVLESYKHRKAA